MTIPKIIHFVWLGGGKKPPLVERCIKSWHRYLPDYEIVEWSEKNFDVEANAYVRGAIQERKWAFASDYIRLYALMHHGGVYLDSDVEVFKSFDRFLKHHAFTGFEQHMGQYSPITAVMGSIPSHSWISDLLGDYNNARFEGNYTNTARITDKMINTYGILNNNCYQVFSDDVHLYPAEFFCTESPDSYSCHHFGGSWLPLHSRLAKKFRSILKR